MAVGAAFHPVWIGWLAFDGAVGPIIQTDAASRSKANDGIVKLN